MMIISWDIIENSDQSIALPTKWEWTSGMKALSTIFGDMQYSETKTDGDIDRETTYSTECVGSTYSTLLNSTLLKQ